MKTFIVMAIAMFSLGVGAADAQSFSHRAPASYSAGQYNWTAGGGG